MRLDDRSAESRHRNEGVDPGRNPSDCSLSRVAQCAEQLERQVSTTVAIAGDAGQGERPSLAMVHARAIEEAAAWTSDGVVVQRADQSEVPTRARPRNARRQRLGPSVQMDDGPSVVQIGKSAVQNASRIEIPGHLPLRCEPGRIGANFMLLGVDHLDAARSEARIDGAHRSEENNPVTACGEALCA